MALGMTTSILEVMQSVANMPFERCLPKGENGKFLSLAVAKAI
jgi:hypothetical protein